MAKEKEEWSNWSGSLKFSPAEMLTPESEEEISAIVKRAASEQKKVRVVGAGHSSSPLVKTDDILVCLSHFTGVENPDRDKCQATVLGGMTVKDAGKEIYRFGLAMHNTGDVDVQNVAGAIGTGTHGTGKKLGNLSTMLTGVRMVTGTGEIKEFSADDNEQLMRALRLSLGTCGIFLKMRLQLVPAYELHRQEWCVKIDKCMENLEELAENNRNFDFYWYPRSDLAKIRIMNEAGKKMPDIGYGTLDKEMKGLSHEILPRARELKFDEMEYSFPAEAAPACFLEVRELIKKKHRKDVGWRLLYRTIAADNNYLSPMFGHPSVTISLHHNAGLPYEEYFAAIEPVFRAHGGRPHWGKKHNQTARELSDMYPEWDTFHHYRQQLDPQNVFLTPYMRQLLIGDK